MLTSPPEPEPKKNLTQPLVKSWDVRLEPEGWGAGRSGELRKEQVRIFIFPKKWRGQPDSLFLHQDCKCPAQPKAGLRIAFPSGAGEGLLDALQL